MNEKRTMVSGRRQAVLVFQRSPGVIPVGTFEGFAGLDVSAQHIRTATTLRQPLESLVSASGARNDDCNQYNDE